MYKENTKEIENLITDYFNGIFYGDTAKLETCFYKNAYIYGDIKEVDYLKSVNEYINGVRSRQSPKDLDEEFKMETIGIDIMGRVAMVKLHLPMLGYNYYDYLSLAKINNDWRIVNKIFTHLD